MRYWFFANDHLAPLSVYQNVIIMCSIEFIFFSQNRASLHQRAQFLWDTKNQLADWRAYVHTSKMRGLNFQRDPWVSTNLCLVLKTSIIYYYRIILDKVVWGFFPWLGIYYKNYCKRFSYDTSVFFFQYTSFIFDQVMLRMTEWCIQKENWNLFVVLVFYDHVKNSIPGVLPKPMQKWEKKQRQQ